MTLFVPSAYTLTTLSEAGCDDGTEWHVFVDVTAEDREETIYLHLVPYIRGRIATVLALYRFDCDDAPMPGYDVDPTVIRWKVARMTMNAATRTNIERLCTEYYWPDVPRVVRNTVLRDLGIAE